MAADTSISGPREVGSTDEPAHPGRTGGRRMLLVTLTVAALAAASIAASLLVRTGETVSEPPPGPTAPPVPTLPEAADPVLDPDRVVDEGLRTDPDHILEVESAAWEGDGTPMRLVWRIARPGGEGTIDCVDCAWLAPHVKSFLALALARPEADGVTAVEGFDPSRAGEPGADAGAGWAVRLLVPVDESGRATREGDATAESIVAWLLGCDGTCTNQDLGVLDVRFDNLRWAVSSCADALAATPVSLVDPVYDAEIADAATTGERRFLAHAVSADGAYVGLPLVVPVYAGVDGVEQVDHWASTQCPGGRS